MRLPTRRTLRVCVPAALLLLSTPDASRSADDRPLTRATAPVSPVADSPAPVDPKVRPSQIPDLAAIVPDVPIPTIDSQSISLSAALYGALTGNPDLVALRQNAPASAEAVEVARRFPTTLNPTLWIDFRPIVFEPAPGGGYGRKDPFIYISWRQPIELGHQTTHRHAIAKAAYSQAQWLIVQSELTAIVQTYRLFETAAYRRERLRVSRQLSEFNEKLLVALRKRLEINPTSAADVALAEVETEATRQLVESASHDYAIALTDLHNQIGTPETAGLARPIDPFVAPHDLPSLDESALIPLALANRAEIHVARAGVAGAKAAINLANGDRRPTPVIGPDYQRDQSAREFVGIVLVVPVPVLNNGMPLVRQREAEHRRALIALQQVEQRTITQVRAAVAKWNQAKKLVDRTKGLTKLLEAQVQQIERLFEENQADLTKLLQARQRLIQLETAEVDAVWQATQAHADLLLALGAPNLIHSLLDPAQMSAPATAAAPPTPEATRPR